VNTMPQPSPSDARRHVLARRAEKRAAAEEIGVDAGFIDAMVETFYAAIRKDDLLAPIFAERVDDWPKHLTRMKAFWRSVLYRHLDNLPQTLNRPRYLQLLRKVLAPLATLFPESQMQKELSAQIWEI